MDQLIERPDLVTMIQAHDGLQEKARLAVLHESGLRAGEFCALCIDSVQSDKYAAVLSPFPRSAAPGPASRAACAASDSSRAPPPPRVVRGAPEEEGPLGAPLHGMRRRAPRERLPPSALWTFCIEAGEAAGLQKSTRTPSVPPLGGDRACWRGWNEAPR